MSHPPYGEWSAEQKAYHHVMKATQGLVAHRAWLRRQPQNDWVTVQQIATANEALASLARVQSTLANAPIVDDEIQLRLDMEE